MTAKPILTALLACTALVPAGTEALAKHPSSPCAVVLDPAADATRAFVGLEAPGAALPNDSTLDLRALAVSIRDRRAVFQLAVTDVVNAEQRGSQGRLYEIDVTVGTSRFIVDAYLAVDGSTTYSAFRRDDGAVQTSQSIADVRGELNDARETITVRVPMSALDWSRHATATKWAVTASRTIERGSSTSRTHILVDDAAGDGVLRGDGRCRATS